MSGRRRPCAAARGGGRRTSITPATVTPATSALTVLSSIVAGNDQGASAANDCTTRGHLAGGQNLQGEVAGCPTSDPGAQTLTALSQGNGNPRYMSAVRPMPPDRLLGLMRELLPTLAGG